jgi:membrane fusion protein (multidrug efflux system)
MSGVVLLALCACKTQGGAGDAAAHGGMDKAQGQPAVHVDSVVVGEREVPTTMTVTGTIEADRRTELAANASGRVTRTFVERGDHVKAGQLLAQLDSRGAAISHSEAEANAKQVSDQLQAVRAECTRYEALRKKGAITQQEYDRQASQCLTQASSEEAARARLAEAARVLEDSAIRAPFAGVIGERFVSVGDYVQPSSKVVTLMVDDPLRLRISVPEPAIPYATEGTEVTFKVLTMPDQEFKAKIKYVGREIRPNTRDMIDEAVVENHDHKLLPGTFVTVQLPVGSAKQAIVPTSAEVQTDNGATVYAIVNGRLEQRAAQTTVSVDGGVAVAEGVKKGDRIVVKPPPELQDGARVE